MVKEIFANSSGSLDWQLTFLRGPDILPTQDLLGREIVAERRRSMTEREVCIQHASERMLDAFCKGDLIDAQNIEAFIRSLEEMTDQEYNEIVQEESGAIS